jgi:hypothetical protein
MSFIPGIRSKAFIMSSMIPINCLYVVATTNGSLQVSASGGMVGILVERDGMALGTILDRAQLRALRLALSQRKTKRVADA